MTRGWIRFASVALFTFSYACHAAAATNSRTVVGTGSGIEGTLFFSRLQRDQLDRARHQVRSEPSKKGPDITQRPKSSIINGFVKRSDGLTSVWVDEEARAITDATVSAGLDPNIVGAPLSRIRKPEKLQALVREQQTKRPRYSNAKRKPVNSTSLRKTED
jgi:hypothetical protein